MPMRSFLAVALLVGLEPKVERSTGLGFVLDHVQRDPKAVLLGGLIVPELADGHPGDLVRGVDNRLEALAQAQANTVVDATH